MRTGDPCAVTAGGLTAGLMRGLARWCSPDSAGTGEGGQVRPGSLPAERFAGNDPLRRTASVDPCGGICRMARREAFAEGRLYRSSIDGRLKGRVDLSIRT